MNTDLSERSFLDLACWLLRLRRRYRVAGASMRPALQPGDEVLVNPRAYRRRLPAPGDIVVLHNPLQPELKTIKRVITDTDNGRYIVQGDNKSESTDSRHYGPVAGTQILGQVTSRF